MIECVNAFIIVGARIARPSFSLLCNTGAQCAPVQNTFPTSVCAFLVEYQTLIMLSIFLTETVIYIIIARVWRKI